MSNGSNTISLRSIMDKAETLGKAEGKGSKSRGAAIEQVIMGATMKAIGADKAGEFWAKFQLARAIERGEAVKSEDGKYALREKGKDFDQRVSNLKTAIAASEILRDEATTMIDQVATMKDVVTGGEWSKKEFEAIYRLAANVKKNKRALSRDEMATIFAPKGENDDPKEAKSEIEMLDAAIKAVNATLNGAKAAPANGNVARPGYVRPETQAALAALNAARSAAEIEAKQAAAQEARDSYAAFMQ